MSKNMELENILSLCTMNGRISFRPNIWLKFHKLLSNFENNTSDELLPPLILSGWSYSSDWEKKTRMTKHLSWAARNNCLDEVEKFMKELSEEDWYSNR